MQRRQWLKLVGLLCLIPSKVLAMLWNTPAFETESLQTAMDALQIKEIKKSPQIKVIAADKAENGAVVQVEVIAELAETEAIVLMIEGNPTPLIAHFQFSADTVPHVVTRVKMAKTAHVQALVKSKGQWYANSKQVIVLEDGCGGSDSDREFQTSMKLRARKQEAFTEVKAIIVHPMNTGRTKNVEGRLIPAHFIQNVTVQRNGNTVLEIQFGTGISRNPYLTFYLKNAELGDKIALQWRDNLGQAGQGESFVIN